MKNLKRLLGYTQGSRLTLFIITVAIFLSVVTQAFYSYFIKIIIDDNIVPMLISSNPSYDGLIRNLAQMTGVILVTVLSILVYFRLSVHLGHHIIKKIRDDVFIKIQSLPIKYFDTKANGDIMSLFTNDVDTLRQLLVNGLPNIIASILMLVASLIMMLFISVYLTVFVIVTVFLIMTFIKKFMAKRVGAYSEQQQSLANLNGFIEEMVSGVKVVKVFNQEQTTTEKFLDLNEKWRKSAFTSTFSGNAIMPFMNSFGYFQYVMVAIIGAALAINTVPNLSLTGFNVLTIGTIATFLTLTRNFTQPIGQVAGQFNLFAVAIAGAGRLFDALDEMSEVDNGYVSLIPAKKNSDGSLTEISDISNISKNDFVWAWKHPHSDGTTTIKKVMGNIVLDCVNFSYSSDKQVLKDISIYASPGQQVALVGATGAGKTTISNLLNRFYDIDDGKIRIDDININKIKKNDLRASIGLVLQDIHLFTDTVMENIRYGNPRATDAECIAAAKLANAHGFIKLLPEGYNTVLSESSGTLSQGQRQLISIARAAVANTPVMILDEATSSVDTRTEQLIQTGMNRLVSGRTTFVIAHRLSTIKKSDVIMVMQDGRIIERGSHDKLIEEGNVYYQLYTGAFELD